MSGKLTKAQRKTLEWLDRHEPATLIPVGGPSIMMLRRCKASGWVDDTGRSRSPKSSFPLTVFTLTSAGREALREQS